MIEVRNGIAQIPSSRKRTVKYNVHYSPMLKRWLCDCPDFRYRQMDSGEDCKHIKEYLEVLETASNEQLEEMVYDRD